jgi:hypothetical protein
MDDDDFLYEDDPRHDCEHEEYEADILTGIASCDRCGHRWMQSFEEIEAEHMRIAAYQQYQDREDRRQWWRDLWYDVKSFFRWRKPPQMVHDDDIPF